MKKEYKYLPKYLESDEIVSATECTGLIPALPSDEFEDEAYSDIYPVPEQHNEK